MIWAAKTLPVAPKKAINHKKRGTVFIKGCISFPTFEFRLLAALQTEP